MISSNIVDNASINISTLQKKKLKPGELNIYSRLCNQQVGGRELRSHSRSQTHLLYNKGHFSFTQWRFFIHLLECPLLTSLSFCSKWLRKQVHCWLSTCGRQNCVCLTMCSKQGNSNTMAPSMGMDTAPWRSGFFFPHQKVTVAPKALNCQIVSTP